MTSRQGYDYETTTEGGIPTYHFSKVSNPKAVIKCIGNQLFMTEQPINVRIEDGTTFHFDPAEIGDDLIGFMPGVKGYAAGVLRDELKRVAPKP